MKVKSSKGTEFEVNEQLLNDMEVIDAMADVLSGEDLRAITGVSNLVDKLLGKQKKMLYNEVRDEKGIVDYVKISEEFKLLLSQLKAESKN